MCVANARTVAVASSGRDASYQAGRTVAHCVAGSARSVGLVMQPSRLPCMGSTAPSGQICLPATGQGAGRCFVRQYVSGTVLVWEVHLVGACVACPWLRND